MGEILFLKPRNQMLLGSLNSKNGNKNKENENEAIQIKQNAMICKKNKKIHLNYKNFTQQADLNSKYGSDN